MVAFALAAAACFADAMRARLGVELEFFFTLMIALGSMLALSAFGSAFPRNKQGALVAGIGLLFFALPLVLLSVAIFFELATNQVGWASVPEKAVPDVVSSIFTTTLAIGALGTAVLLLALQTRMASTRGDGWFRVCALAASMAAIGDAVLMLQDGGSFFLWGIAVGFLGIAFGGRQAFRPRKPVFFGNASGVVTAVE